MLFDLIHVVASGFVFDTVIGIAMKHGKRRLGRPLADDTFRCSFRSGSGSGGHFGRSRGSSGRFGCSGRFCRLRLFSRLRFFGDRLSRYGSGLCSRSCSFSGGGGLRSRLLNFGGRSRFSGRLRFGRGCGLSRYGGGLFLRHCKSYRHESHCKSFLHIHTTSFVYILLQLYFKKVKKARIYLQSLYFLHRMQAYHPLRHSA